MATTQSKLSELLPGFPAVEETPTTMHVRKRNGSLESVDVNKIVRAVQRCSNGLSQADAMRIASKTIGGLWGRSAYEWLFVELLFIPEELRGQGLGTTLLRQAEERQHVYHSESAVPHFSQSEPHAAALEGAELR